MIIRTATALAATALALAGALASGPASAQPAGRAAAGTHDLLTRPAVARAFDSDQPVTRHAGRGDGDLALSACTGEMTLRDLVGRRDPIVHATFEGRTGDGARLAASEQVAGRPSVAKAAASYRHIVREVRACQDVPEGHWYYGRAHRWSTDAGTATWMLTFNGDGTRAGGYIALTADTRVGVVEVSAPVGPRQVSALARAAVLRAA